MATVEELLSGGSANGTPKKERVMLTPEARIVKRVGWLAKDLRILANEVSTLTDAERNLVLAAVRPGCETILAFPFVAPEPKVEVPAEEPKVPEPKEKVKAGK